MPGASSADYYGVKYMGVNYGCIFTAFGVAGTVGPMLAGKIRDATGYYTGAYYTCAAMLIVAVALAFITKPPKQTPAQTPAQQPALAGVRK